MTREQRAARAGRDFLVRRLGTGVVARINCSVDVEDPDNDPLAQATGKPYPEARRMLGLTRKQAIDLGFDYRPAHALSDIPRLNEAWFEIVLEAAQEAVT